MFHMPWHRRQRRTEAEADAGSASASARERDEAQQEPVVEVSNENGNAGVLEHGWQVRNARVLGLNYLEALPSRMIVLETLELVDLPLLETLPMDLNAQSISILRCEAFCTLGEAFMLQGSLFLEDLPNLQELPADMHVGGSCTLKNLTKIASLPKRMQVGGDLALVSCQELSKLPDGVYVTGDISIQNCMAITDLPISMVELRGAVSLFNTGISDERVIKLQDMAHPNLAFFVDREMPDPFESIKEAVEFWYEEDEERAGYLIEMLEARIPEFYVSDLLLFLSKMRVTKEFFLEEVRPGLKNRVSEALTILAEDSSSREEVLIMISDSLNTCGDKIAWTLSQIAILSRVVKARGDGEALRQLGRGMMRLMIVHEHVRAKLDEIRHDSRLDDVCVYLRFEIALRDELQLPVSAQAMLFPKYVKVFENDIDEARRAALTPSEEEFEKWLETWPEWQRFQREEFAKTVSWESLPLATNQPKETTLSLLGEKAFKPVRLGETGDGCEFGELMDRWVETGMDFVNHAWTIEKFKNNLYRLNQTQ